MRSTTLWYRNKDYWEAVYSDEGFADEGFADEGDCQVQQKLRQYTTFKFFFV